MGALVGFELSDFVFQPKYGELCLSRTDYRSVFTFFLLLRLMNLLNGETVYTFDLEIRIEESEDISDCRLSGQLTVFPPNLPAVTRLC